MVEMEMERDRLCRELQSVTGRLRVVERTGSDLTEEYMTLKRNYLALTEAHNKEVVQNDELSAELLGLAQARDDLFRQTEEQQQRVRASTEGGVYGQAAQELDRVRALVSRMSHNRVMVRGSFGSFPQLAITTHRNLSKYISYKAQKNYLITSGLIPIWLYNFLIAQICFSLITARGPGYVGPRT